MSSSEGGWIWVFGGVLAGKGNGGGVGALLRSRDIEGEERRGGGGLVRAAPRGGKSREGPGSIAPHGWRMVWGAWQPARRAAGGGGRQSVTCEQGRRGCRAWVVREGVGRSGKGGRWAGPERTVPISI
jgi:hypothetical protein